MRSRLVSRSLVPSLVGFAAGLAASAALRRLAARRRPGAGDVAPRPVRPLGDPDAVVLPFVRRAVETPAPAPAPAPTPAPARPAVPARCGDNGGRTRAGAPCAARAGAGGRCHHHVLAA